MIIKPRIDAANGGSALHNTTYFNEISDSPSKHGLRIEPRIEPRIEAPPRANIVHTYRGKKPEKIHDGKDFEKKFKGGKYQDIPGLCKVATLTKTEEQGWSLNPGRYVGVGEQRSDDGNFDEEIAALNEELLLQQQKRMWSVSLKRRPW